MRYLLLALLLIPLAAYAQRGNWVENAGSPITKRTIMNCESPIQCVDTGTETALQIIGESINTGHINDDAVTLAKLDGCPTGTTQIVEYNSGVASCITTPTGGGGGGARNIFFAYDSAGDTSITTDTIIPLGTNPENDAAYGTIAANEVPINTTGRYRVTGTITYDITNTSGGTRGSMAAKLQVDSVDVAYCAGSSYQRETAGRSQSMFSCIVDLTAGEDVSMVGSRETATVNIDTVASRSTLTMELMD